ncbi:putative valacyclovir hydrolase [Dactylonectria estremocensis]|uniref:Valacyclovir hydrolase n=1 Tax=Dactylonectria estremocensis TaxID=1079267 RepID=A0A9P9E4C0_9HYPO|nr:putative valacyclovir hydrolase [Dactylonectria estremocensis]
MSDTLLVLPRPGTTKPGDVPEVIPAPPEADFVATFGSLLPPASYLSTPNGKAAYYELPPSSPADGTTPVSRVLFVHGVQTCAIGLHKLSSALASRFPQAHLVLVDLWGHGLTDTPLLPHEPALFHGLLEALMVHLGWEDAHLIGYSFGAATTASFTAAKPERVSSMVLIAPAGFIREAQFSDLQRSYLRGGEGLEEPAKAWILDLLEGGPLVVPSDWKEKVARGEVVAQAVRDWQLKNHKGHAASVIAIFRDGGVMDKDEEFAKAVKTGKKHLAILGELDDINTVEDFHNIGMQNVVVIPQVAHAVVRDKGVEVAQFIEEFWNNL